MLFLKEHQKKLLNKFPSWGFYFPGIAFNDESNGTNPPSVSFLYDLIIHSRHVHVIVHTVGNRSHCTAYTVA